MNYINIEVIIEYRKLKLTINIIIGYCNLKINLIMF